MSEEYAAYGIHTSQPIDTADVELPGEIEALIEIYLTSGDRRTLKVLYALGYVIVRREDVGLLRSMLISGERPSGESAAALKAIEEAFI